MPTPITLHIELRAVKVAETQGLDENTLLKVDTQGNICAITFEHASERAGVPEFSYEQIAPLLEAQNKK